MHRYQPRRNVETLKVAAPPARCSATVVGDAGSDGRPSRTAQLERCRQSARYAAQVWADRLPRSERWPTSCRWASAAAVVASSCDTTLKSQDVRGTFR